MKTCEVAESSAVYSREIDRLSVMSTCEKNALFAQMIEAGKNEDTDLCTHLRNVIAEQSLRLVISAAKDIWRQYRDLPFEDMVQAGNLGLLRAIEKFDPDRGFTFSNYAFWWIQFYIIEACRYAADGMPVSRDTYQAQRRAKKIPGWRSLDSTVLAEMIGASVETAETLQGIAGRRMVELDAPPPHAGDGGGRLLHEFIPDVRANMNPEERAIARIDCTRFLKGVDPLVVSAIVRNRVNEELLSDIAPQLDHLLSRTALSMRIAKALKQTDGFEEYRS